MTDYNKYSITSVVKDFDEEEMEGRQVRFGLNTEDDVFFLIDDDEIITDSNKTLTKYATTDENGTASVEVYLESNVESETVKASIDGITEQILIFNSGIRVSSVALQTDKNTIYNGNKNENATLTATVTASETYTGVVAFYDGNTLLGTVSAVNNVATFTLQSTNHSMVTPTVTRNIRAVAGGVNSNVLEITDYYTYPNLILIRPYYNGRLVTQVPENETWRLQIGLRDNRQAAVPNATGTVSIDGVEQEITLGNDGFWNYNITNGSGTGSVSVTASFGNLTDSMNVGIVLHDCTDIMFSQASYTADSDGNVTLEVTLINDDVAVPNATVSLSDGTSVYTGITNTNGVATFNLTGLSASASWTCSYSNVSDTCTVTVQTYGFYDDARVDNSSQYTSYPIQGTNGKVNIAWSSAKQAYAITNNTTSGRALLQFGDTLLQNNVRISADIKLGGVSYNNNGMLAFIDKDSQTTYSVAGWVQGQKYYRLTEFNGTTELQTTPNSTWSSLSTSDYNHHELVYQNGVVTYTVTTPSSQTKTVSLTLQKSNYIGGKLGLFIELFSNTTHCSIKNIKVESL